MSPLDALAREYRSLPRVYWVLWLGMLVNKAGGFVVPFLAIYLSRERGYGEAIAGAVMALYGAGTVLAGLVGGTLADRLGRRATMLLSLFGGAAAMLGLALAKPLWAIATATFLMGWVAEMYRPAVSAMVADLVPVADRTRAFGHLYWVINLGFALAPPLAGLALRTGYLTLFVIDAATMAACGLIVLARVPETRPAAAAQHRSEAAALREIARDGPFLGFTLLVFGTAIVMWQNGTALPLDMIGKGVTVGAYGALMGLNGVLIVVLQPLLSRRLGELPRARVLAVASVVFGIGFGMYGLVRTPAGYSVAIAIWTLAEIAILPTSAAMVAELAPAALRGRYQGLYGVAWGGASALGPLLGGALLAGPGAGALWGGCAALMLLVALGHLAVGKAITRRASRGP